MKASKKQAIAYVKGTIAPSQIKAIHATSSKLGLDDDTYRAMLLDRYGVDSCKRLTWRQAEELLQGLNGTVVSSGKTCPSHKHALKYQNLDGRPGFATGAQCRLIDAMFAQVTRAQCEETIEHALNSFCSRICHVAGLRMVKGWQVEKIVKALESMGAVKKGA